MSNKILWSRLFAFFLAFVCCFAIAEELPGAIVTPTPVLPEQESSLLQLGGLLQLVNRQNKVSKTYVPELVQPDVQTRKASLEKNILMRPEAALALEKMFQAAYLENGYTLLAASGYRSFGIQQILFNSKVEDTGSREKAQWRVAPAGTSEHQLGLAMDIQAPSHLNLNTAFGSTEEGAWAGENAHRFGYILRYKTDWRDLTGISDEPWHFRYVGIAHATAMYELDIPLETYVEYAKLLPAYVLEGGSHVLLVGLIGAMMKGEETESLDILRSADQPDREMALRNATIPFLQEGSTYEEVLWYAYPTPKPTAQPRVDTDTEYSLTEPNTGG